LFRNVEYLDPCHKLANGPTVEPMKEDTVGVKRKRTEHKLKAREYACAKNSIGHEIVEDPKRHEHKEVNAACPESRPKRLIPVGTNLLHDCPLSPPPALGLIPGLSAGVNR